MKAKPIEEKCEKEEIFKRYVNFCWDVYKHIPASNYGFLITTEPKEIKMTNLEISQNIGQQVYDNFNKPGALLCPICSRFGDEQPLSSWGDEREYLFCPHCDLTIKLIIVMGG